MKYQTAPAEKSTVKVTMTFDAAEWAEANNQAYLKNRKKYAVNGFRKGKVPKHVLETFYGKGLFYEDALNLLYAQHYGEVLEKEKNKFTAVGDPSLAVDDITDEKVVLVATVPVKPDVKIEKYTGIKIKKVEYTVTDADLEKEIENNRNRLAEKIEVTDRAAQNDDTVSIDFTGRADGKEFEGGSAENYDLTLGSGSFIAGFEEQVVGMKIGETKDINVTFPEDYQAEHLKGKPAVFTVTLQPVSVSLIAFKCGQITGFNIGHTGNQVILKMYDLDSFDALSLLLQAFLYAVKPAVGTLRRLLQIGRSTRQINNIIFQLRHFSCQNVKLVFHI